MGEDLIEMRLIRCDRWQQVARWEGNVDTRDGKQMREALVAAVKSEVGEAGDWKAALSHHVMEWRWGPSCGWRTFRAAK